MSSRNVQAVLLTTAVLSGPIALGLLGNLARYPNDLPGYWDYPSGTLGDALLLPAIVAGLYVQLRKLPPSGWATEQWMVAAGVVAGAVLGAAVPLSWLLNPDTANMWLLPEAQSFSIAGWVHTGYATMASAVIGGLSVCMLCRVRAIRMWRGLDATILDKGALTAAFGAGLGQLLLIGRDAIDGASTASSTVTLGALALVVIAALVGIRWATGPLRLRDLVLPGGIVMLFLSGLILIMVDWPPPNPLVLAAGACSVFVGVCAIALCLEEDRASPYRWPIIAAVGTLLTGGLVRATAAYGSNEQMPIVWLIGVSAVAFLAVVAFNGRRLEIGLLARYMLFVSFCLLMIYLAAALSSSGTSRDIAGSTIGAAEVAFTIIVFTVIQARYSDSSRRDEANIATEYVPHEEGLLEWKSSMRARSVEVPSEPMLDVALLGTAVSISLFTLLATATEPLGLNRGTVPPDTIRLFAIAALAGLIAILASNEAWMNKWRTRRGEPKVGPSLEGLDLPRAYWLIPTISATLWAGTAIALSGGHKHLWVLSAAVSVIVCAFYLRSLIYSTTVLHTIRPSKGNIVLAVWVSICCGYATFVFLSIGLWQGASSLSGTWVVMATVVYLLGTFAVYFITASTLANGLPVRKRAAQAVLARRAVREYVSLDGVVLGVVVVIGVVIPLFAASREVMQEGSALSVVASMVFLPGLIAGVVWGLEGWRLYDARMQEASSNGTPLAVIERAGYDRASARAMDYRRVKILHHHIVYLRVCVIAAMTLGLTYLAYTLVA